VGSVHDHCVGPMTEWKRIPVEGGESYFYNSTTGDSQWETPADWVEPVACDPAWTEVKDADSGDVYYYNTESGESSWEKPDGFVSNESVTDATPSSQSATPWMEVADPESEGVYYYNTITQESVWEKPADFDVLQQQQQVEDQATDKEQKEAVRKSRRATIDPSLVFAESSPTTMDTEGDDAGEGGEGEEERGGGGGGEQQQSRQSRRRSLPSSSSGDDQTAKRKSLSLFRSPDSPDGEEKDHDDEAAESGHEAVDLATVDPEAPLEDYCRLLAGVTLDQFASKVVTDFRRKSVFSKAEHATVNSSAMSWSPEPLSQPLTHLSTPELVTVALTTSKNILGFTGDRVTRNKSPVELATAIVTLLLDSPQEARDEALLQLCKHLRGNPSPKSIEMGWQLLLICLAAFAPSKQLGPHLMAFCLSTAEAQQVLLKNGAGSGLYEIFRCSEKATRACVLSSSLPARIDMLANDELEALRRGTKTEVTVRLVDGRHLALPADSWTSVERLGQLVAMELSVHPVNAKCFALFESDERPGGSERRLGKHERVLDLFFLWTHHNHTNHHHNNHHHHASPASGFHFVYKVAHFLDRTARGCALIDADHAAVKLLYAQVVADVLAARYPCSENEAVLLAAVQTQELFGDLHVKPSTLTDLSSVLGGRSLHQFINHRFLGSHTDSHEQLLIRRSAVEEGIAKAYSRLKGYSPADARLAYLNLMRANKLYGAAYFRAQAAKGVGALPAEVILAITPTEVVVVQPETSHFLAEYPIETLDEWGHTAHASTLVLVSTSDERHFFKLASAAHAEEICELLDSYMRHL